jgi:N-acetylneuraminic acid mutarotase
MVGGLQNWEQSLEERAAAWQAAMDFMGLECQVAVAVVDGIKLRITAAGKDEEPANAFIQEVIGRFPMGKYELEQQMIADTLMKYRKK